MRFTRIDAFEMNFEECSVDRKYKFSTTTGSGEARIYAGHDEQLLDEFFDLENIESFIMLKNDLIKLLEDSKKEYYEPVQSYRENISIFYEDNLIKTRAISEDTIKLNFVKKYDSQHRYYLNFKDTQSKNEWKKLRDIALPHFTKLNFLKIRNVEDNKLYIYIKPFFYIDELEEETKEIEIAIETGNTTRITQDRRGQAKYRRDLLDRMPACIITKVTEDRILEACHIKPHSVCNEDEKYDKKNGLILTPTYHVLFDMGFITFEDNGKIRISPFLSNLNKQRLRIEDNTLYRIPSDCSVYLEYHRNNVFNKVPEIEI